MTVPYPFIIGEDEGQSQAGRQQENPFFKPRRASARIEASDLEPFSLVDEVEFTRRFQDIARLADDDSDDSVLLQHTANDYHSDDYAPSSFSLDPSDGNPGFNARLIVPAAVSPPLRLVSSQQASPRRPSYQDKSFLDDDWLLNRVEHDSNMAMVAAGLVRPRSAVQLDDRCKTPLPEVYHHPFSSLHVSKTNSPIRSDHDHVGRPKGQSSSHNGPPPRDYVCKLCNVSGHWLKDCDLFEPRENLGKPGGNVKNYKTVSSSSSSVSGNKPNGTPPGNYVCRLCGVSGHWIEQCSQFQHKMDPKTAGNQKERLACFKSIPPPPGYICNLCHSPGHWLQQCSRFEPIPSHKRKDHHHYQHNAHQPYHQNSNYH